MIKRCPELFSYIQGRVDDSDKPGMYVLTGSQQFGLMENITQSLAGRIGILKLLPFDYSELSAGGVAQKTPEEALFKGGYPALYDQADWFDTMKWWRSLPNSKAGKDAVVYAGDTCQRRSRGEVVRWMHTSAWVRELVRI